MHPRCQGVMPWNIYKLQDKSLHLTCFIFTVFYELFLHFRNFTSDFSSLFREEVFLLLSFLQDVNHEPHHRQRSALNKHEHELELNFQEQSHNVSTIDLDDVISFIKYLVLVTSVIV